MLLSCIASVLLSFDYYKGATIRKVFECIAVFLVLFDTAAPSYVIMYLYNDDSCR